MARAKRSWMDKLLDDKDLPKVVPVEGKMARRWGSKEGDTCVVPAPREVDALMKRVPEGQVVTTNELRSALAKRHHATMGCPITTGIFAWIAAHAAEEALAKKAVTLLQMTPYWRTLKTGGELNPKYPGGPAAAARKLRAEGHTITRKGARYFVADYQQALARLD